jgi:hypothetical protein
LDAAVLEAYGWADLHPLTPEREPELLTRLVALNHERAAEEQRGHIRWLRPDYQAPTAAPPPPTDSENPATPAVIDRRYRCCPPINPLSLARKSRLL